MFFFRCNLSNNLNSMSKEPLMALTHTYPLHPGIICITRCLSKVSYVNNTITKTVGRVWGLPVFGGETHFVWKTSEAKAAPGSIPVPCSGLFGEPHSIGFHYTIRHAFIIPPPPLRSLPVNPSISSFLVLSLSLLTFSVHIVLYRAIVISLPFHPPFWSFVGVVSFMTAL